MTKFTGRSRGLWPSDGGVIGKAMTPGIAANLGNNSLAMSGERRVRSVQSVTMNGADTGFFAIVLVRPLATLMVRGIDAPYEKDLFLLATELPVVEDDAYLSAIVLPGGSLSGLAVRGAIRTIWN